MTATRPIAAADHPAERGLASTVFFWSLLQVTVLAIAAGEWPLVVAQGVVTERLALAFLVAMQFAVGSLFAGALLGSVSRAVYSITLTWPMLQLAGLLAGQPQSHIIAAAAAVSLWLASLSCWTAAVPHRARPVVSAIASAWAIGGVAVAYCHADFGSNPGQSVFRMDAWVSPLLGTIQLCGSPHHAGTWGVLAVNCGLAAALLVIAKICRRSSPAAEASTSAASQAPHPPFL